MHDADRWRLKNVYVAQAAIYTKKHEMVNGLSGSLRCPLWVRADDLIAAIWKIRDPAATDGSGTNLATYWKHCAIQGVETVAWLADGLWEPRVEGVMNRTAIVTGEASTTGLAVAEHLLSCGWSVAIVDADQRAVTEAEEFLAGEDVLFLLADISDEVEVEQAFDNVVDALGLCSALVNCAGVRREAMFEDTSVEMLREMLEINLVGPFITAQAALERMADQLVIINILPTSAVRPKRGHAALAASKAGLRMMSEIMALENFGRAVRVNCVATAGSGASETDRGSRRTIRTGEKREIISVKEVAGAVAYLLSDEARFVNGHTLVLGGDGEPSDAGR